MKAPFIVSCILLPVALNLPAQVWVYEYPEMIVNANNARHSRSTLVDVQVEQGENTYQAYVMYDKNQKPEGNLALNPDNHWTNFSMSGTVTVKVTRLDAYNITFCNIYPLKKGITASINGKTASFNLSEDMLPLQVYVEMNNMPMDAILIFADPPETDVPDKEDPDVEVILTSDDITTVRSKLQNAKTTKYFEKGIHQWGETTGTGYPGYKLPLVSGKKIYIPGGAYVIGTFSGSPSNNKIYGRGVLSSAGKDQIGGTTGIPYSTVMSDGSGTGQVLEGFVSLCPPHFHLTVRGQVVIDNVKMMSWWHSTDGIVTGHNSVVKNCFFKVMDDFIKLYSDNCTHENNTMFHQVNGAPFQFSWGNQHSKNNVMIDTYIVNSIYKGLSGTSNTAVINAKSGKTGNVTENQKWDGLYIDNGCHRLLGLEPEGGTHRNFEIKNVELNSGNKDIPQTLWSYLLNGVFSDIQFINFTMNGYPVITTNTQSDQPANGSWWFQGATSALVLGECNDDIPPGPPGEISIVSVGETRIELSWGPSTDNTGVTGYEVFVNDILNKTVPVASATIEGLQCDTEYSIKVRARDACANVSEFTGPVVVRTEECPVLAIPGKIEAEDYNDMSGIQTEPTQDEGGGQNIGYIHKGDWATYPVRVDSTATYEISFRVSSNTVGGSIELVVGEESKGSVDVPVTGGWQSWVTVSETFELEAGDQSWRLNFSGPGTGFLFNLNWFEAILITTGLFSYNGKTGLHVFPNPFRNILYIETDEESLELFTLTGVKIHIRFEKFTGGFLLHGGEMPAGIYLLKVGSGMKKLIKL